MTSGVLASVLAIESGGSNASVALIDRHGALRYASAASGQSHSSRLLPMAQELMHQAGISWGDLDGIAVCVGPGSFTGLRIACGVAQGLALGAQKKLLGISAFEAWSYAWWQMHAQDANDTVSRQAHIDISFDARLGERFHASLSMRKHGAALEMAWMDAPAVVSQESWAGQSRDAKTVVLADCDQDALGQALPLAAWMARYALDAQLQHAHHWLAPRELRPLYVREKVAQTIEERRHAADLQWSPMTERDLASVMVIENQSYPFPWTSGNFMDSMRAGYDMQVLKERGVMIGYLIWMRVLHEAHLLNLALSPARQGHGLGSWMMRQFIARLKSMGINDVLLEVRPSNHRALALYRRFGFVHIGLRKGYYPNHAQPNGPGQDSREDAIVMRLKLAQAQVDHRDRVAAAGHADETAGQQHD
jgi:tRNA threonylcarbamoyladenosine biosynthesis protein TsaB